MNRTLIIIDRRPCPPETVRTFRWLSAFAAIIVATVITVSYLEGGIDESMRESRDVSEQVAALRVQNEGLQKRFDLLADSAGEGAILEAGIHYQELQEARQ